MAKIAIKSTAEKIGLLEKLGFRRVKEFTYQGRRLYRYLLQLN